MRGWTACLFLVVLPHSVWAQNVLVNGGFDGGLGGWVESPDDGITLFVPDEGNVADGCWSLRAPGDLRDLFVFDSLIQVVNTTPGETYELSFYLLNDVAGEDSLRVFWGEVGATGEVWGQTPIQTAEGEWERVSMALTATSNQMELEFLGADADGLERSTLFLDDVALSLADSEAPRVLAVVSRKEHGSGMQMFAFDPPHGSPWPHPPQDTWPGIIGIGFHPPGSPWPHPTENP